MNNLGDSTLLDTLSALQARRQQQEQFNAGIDQQNANREQQGEMARFGDMAQQRNTLQGQAFQTGQAEAERNWQKESLAKHLAAQQEMAKRAYAFKTAKEEQDAREAQIKADLAQKVIDERAGHHKEQDTLGRDTLPTKVEGAHAQTKNAEAHMIEANRPRGSGTPKDPISDVPLRVEQEWGRINSEANALTRRAEAIRRDKERDATTAGALMPGAKAALDERLAALNADRAKFAAKVKAHMETQDPNKNEKWYGFHRSRVLQLLGGGGG